ncbi:MAG: hypothetical protein M2R45_01294 [Verrucomicrobia subdivision 3 bacterium]|nr:hypothetical protein [Limisphaerales bacterium]MCS1415160.1 hypothetical protein [Limisphaerales bacterium]
MPFEIEFFESALADFKKLDARWQFRCDRLWKRTCASSLTRVSKNRIKKLRGIDHPEYRLRVDDIRENFVEILGIVPKRQTEAWLDKFIER